MQDVKNIIGYTQAFEFFKGRAAAAVERLMDDHTNDNLQEAFGELFDNTKSNMKELIVTLNCLDMAQEDYMAGKSVKDCIAEADEPIGEHEPRFVAADDGWKATFRVPWPYKQECIDAEWSPVFTEGGSQFWDCSNSAITTVSNYHGFTQTCFLHILEDFLFILEKEELIPEHKSGIPKMYTMIHSLNMHFIKLHGALWLLEQCYRKRGEA